MAVSKGSASHSGKGHKGVGMTKGHRTGTGSKKDHLESKGTKKHASKTKGLKGGKIPS
ncbi:MAG TPA: hypothetical protein VEP90_20705 [Methylomirabilota bacterium]|nr:hypothetical protein [Methylomirabilota bacterium]